MHAFRSRGVPHAALALASVAALAALVGFLAPAVLAKERGEIPEKYTWNLADLYPNEAAWTAAKETLAKRVPDFARHQGHLGESAAALHAALAGLMDMNRELERLQSYATQLADEDRRVSRSLAMQQESDQLAVQVQTATSFVTPEILAVGAAKVERFLAGDPKLAPYRVYLQDVLRRGPHTLSQAEEKVAAQAGNLTDAGQSVHSVFTNAELPYPEIVLGGGEKVRLDAAAYTRYRALPDRADRDRVFQAFWGTYREYRRTLAAALQAQVKGHDFDKDVHKYASCLEASLFRFNVPTTVYTQLLHDVDANLPALHRYLGLRQRMMGVDRLRYEDLYASIVKKVDLQFTPEQAMEMTFSATDLLGTAYQTALRAGFEARWVDWMPSTGKRSGAYSNAAYGVHPYQLQNFMGRYEDVSTLAHESGHSMHSYLSDKTQPYPTHGYPIFVAEVASTLNENLLFHRMLDGTTDDETRLFLLGSYLDNMRQTLFRQTLFAEFELVIHEQVEKGEALTGDDMSTLYLKLARQYYGHDKNVCQVDSLYGVEWAYIPHFYYNFYVYQYATSMIAAISIANNIRDEAAAKPPSTRARDAYLQLLSAGGSKYPIDLLKDAGVDMTTSEPFRAAIREMNQVIDEIEAVLKRRPKP